MVYGFGRPTEIVGERDDGRIFPPHAVEDSISGDVARSDAHAVYLILGCDGRRSVDSESKPATHRVSYAGRTPVNETTVTPDHEEGDTVI